LLANGAFIGTAGSVPLVDENVLMYDSMGYSYDNGPFLHMERLAYATVVSICKSCNLQTNRSPFDNSSFVVGDELLLFVRITFFANRPIRLVGYDESAIPMPKRSIWPGCREFHCQKLPSDLMIFLCL
jgi:hypothetical protein